MRMNCLARQHLNGPFADVTYFGGMSDPPIRQIRSSVILHARVETGERAVECRVRNLSTTGACIDNTAMLAVGDRVQVVMGTLRWLVAEVIWAKPTLAGLRFDREVNIADARKPRTHVAVAPSAGWVARIADPYRAPPRR